MYILCVYNYYTMHTMVMLMISDYMMKPKIEPTNVSDKKYKMNILLYKASFFFWIRSIFAVANPESNFKYFRSHLIRSFYSVWLYFILFLFLVVISFFNLYILPYSISLYYILPYFVFF